MPKSHAPYPPEFRAEAIRLMRSRNKSMAQLARELDVTSETLRIWRKQADIDEERVTIDRPPRKPRSFVASVVKSRPSGRSGRSL